jgi:pantetheine-phosphate adenylyltransferase
MKHTVVYPGSFDPITNGHIDVIRRALELFDTVVVAVAHNTEKTPVFTVAERVNFIQRAFKDKKRVVVKSFHGLIVQFAEAEGINCVIRGLRATSDFDFEFQMALTNRKVSNQKIETVFLTPSQEYFYISSRLIKELSMFGSSVKHFVPDFVAKALQEKFSSDSKKF